MRPRAAGAALAAAVALASCACTSGGDAGESFRTQANAICADFDERIDAVATPQSIAQLAESADEVAGLVEEGGRRLRQLEPPEGQAEAWSDWLALNDAAAESAARISAAAEQGDRERIVELAEQPEEDEAAADTLAEELALDDCVVDDEPSAR